MKPIISCSTVTKTYNLYRRKRDKLIDLIGNKHGKQAFYALKNITFEVFPGETIGVIGINGSGKSTLANLLAQVMPPTSGNIDINGDSSLIAISAGLNNQLSGSENIQLKCLMNGFKKTEIDNISSAIIEFADIGTFIEQPIKNYSSGMKSRLGFAISVHLNPDILIVDEALSVGDQTFYEKCLLKMNELKANGKTIFFISHSISQLRPLCDRVLWLHFGEVKQFDKTMAVLRQYGSFIKWFNELSSSEKKQYKKTMLTEQFNKDLAVSRKAEKNGWGFYVQTGLLLVVSILSGIWMLLSK
ncbi:ABC transporter ATP-binding protein [Bacillus salipaludis]|uniref:ABC transporter ATP-binding protein n=1 Tax=Bacillus salipaludis TaxID=2547811 RepID=A0ABW8RLD8_9BACI